MIKLGSRAMFSFTGANNDKTTEYIYNTVGMTSLTAKTIGGVLHLPWLVPRANPLFQLLNDVGVIRA